MLTILIAALCSVFSLLMISLIFRKLKKGTLLLFLLTILYFFSFIIVWFHLLKFNGEFETLFPDEATYISESPAGGIFGAYISLLNKYLPLEIHRGLNIIAYFLGTFIIIEYFSFSYKNNFFTGILFLIIVLGSYWNLFILKESFTILGISLYLLSSHKKSRTLKILAFSVLFISRIEIAIIFMLVDFLFLVYQKSRYLFAAILLTGFVILYLNFNHPFVVNLKLFGMSRRFGESFKSFDDAAVSASQLAFFQFIISKPYIETIKFNLSGGFNIISAEGIAKFLVLINFLGLYIVILKIRTLIQMKEFYYLLTAFLVINLTHSTYRYMNVLFIPFVIYFIVVLSQEKFNEENSNTTCIQ